MEIKAGKLFVPHIRHNILRLVQLGRREFVLLLSLVLSAELILGFTSPEYRYQVYDNELTGGHPAAVDETGQRGTVIPLKKSDSEVRILVLGDSVSFGTGVAATDSWPKTLAAALSSEQRAVTCINAAMPGRSVKDNLAGFREQWVDYRPDIVLLGVTNNMVALSHIERNDQPERSDNPYITRANKYSKPSLQTRLKRTYKHLILPSWLSIQAQRLSYWVGISNHNINASSPRGPMLAFGYQQAELSPTISTDAWDQFEDDLQWFRDSVHASGSTCVVVTFPVRFMLSDDAADNEKCVPKQRLTIDSEQRFGDICRTHSIPVIETGDCFRETLEAVPDTAPDQWFLYFDFTHLSPNGHRIVSNCVANQLKLFPSN